jgi:DNA-directed RNA polymerase specialized sigma24 family protein
MARESYGQAYRDGFVRTIRFLVSRGVRTDMARELAQSAWTTGWEKQEQLRNDNLLLTWVNTIAINIYRGNLRGQRSYVGLSELRTAEANSAEVDVRRILGFCRPRDRTLLQLYLQGWTAEEIAGKEGVTTTAIRIRLLRARRRVRSQLEARKIRPGGPANPNVRQHRAQMLLTAGRSRDCSRARPGSWRQIQIDASVGPGNACEDG